jgi:hypothetical protein
MGSLPLGSQGSFRILETTIERTNTTADTQYLDTATDIFWHYAGALDGTMAGAFAQSNALFSASLSSPSSTKVSKVDSWGNFKVSMLETLDLSTADADGWIALDPGNTTYASLIGLSVSSVSNSGNTIFTVEANYWHLTYDPLGTAMVTNVSCAPSGWISTTGGASAITPGMFLSSNRQFQSPANISSKDHRRLGYCGWDRNGTRRANCTLQNSYVEAAVHCERHVCGATRIRRSLKTAGHPPTSWTQLDSSFGSFAWFASPLVQAFGSFHKLGGECVPGVPRAAQQPVRFLERAAGAKSDDGRVRGAHGADAEYVLVCAAGGADGAERGRDW